MGAFNVPALALITKTSLAGASESSGKTTGLGPWVSSQTAPLLPHWTQALLRGRGNELGIINLDGNNLKKKWTGTCIDSHSQLFFVVAPMVPVVLLPEKVHAVTHSERKKKSTEQLCMRLHLNGGEKHKYLSRVLNTYVFVLIKYILTTWTKREFGFSFI